MQYSQRQARNDLNTATHDVAIGITTVIDHLLAETGTIRHQRNQFPAFLEISYQAFAPQETFDIITRLIASETKSIADQFITDQHVIHELVMALNERNEFRTNSN